MCCCADKWPDLFSCVVFHEIYSANCVTFLLMKFYMMFSVYYNGDVDEEDNSCLWSSVSRGSFNCSTIYCQIGSSPGQLFQKMLVYFRCSKDIILPGTDFKHRKCLALETWKNYQYLVEWKRIILEYKDGAASFQFLNWGNMQKFKNCTTKISDFWSNGSVCSL